MWTVITIIQRVSYRSWDRRFARRILRLNPKPFSHSGKCWWKQCSCTLGIRTLSGLVYPGFRKPNGPQVFPSGICIIEYHSLFIGVLRRRTPNWYMHVHILHLFCVLFIAVIKHRMLMAALYTYASAHEWNVMSAMRSLGQPPQRLEWRQQNPFLSLIGSLALTMWLRNLVQWMGLGGGWMAQLAAYPYNSCRSFSGAADDQPRGTRDVPKDQGTECWLGISVALMGKFV